jgi:hypothetical protein
MLNSLLRRTPLHSLAETVLNLQKLAVGNEDVYELVVKLGRQTELTLKGVAKELFLGEFATAVVIEDALENVYGEEGVDELLPPCCRIAGEDNSSTGLRQLDLFSVSRSKALDRNRGRLPQRRRTYCWSSLLPKPPAQHRLCPRGDRCSAQRIAWGILSASSRVR